MTDMHPSAEKDNKHEMKDRAENLKLLAKCVRENKQNDEIR